MPKLESPTRSPSDDSVFTLRISKRTLAEALVALGIIVCLTLLGLYEKKNQPAVSNNGNQVSASVAQTVVTPRQPVSRENSPHPPRAVPQTFKTSLVTPSGSANNASDESRSASASPSTTPPGSETYVQPRLPGAVVLKRPLPAPVPTQGENDPEDHDADVLSVANVDLPGPVLEPITLNGAGTPFPYPLYAKWFTEYHTLHPQVTVNYQSKGSGAGIRQLTEGTIDFAASDRPWTDQQLKETRDKRGVDIIHIPTVLNAVAITYNLHGVRTALRFTPDLLADIFLGTINRWDDRRIRSLNPDLQLPDADILVVHRAEACGTTYILADYLSKVSPQWSDKVGGGMAVQWPTGLAQQGNEAVGSMVRETPGAIGYVDLIYALQNKLSYASILNLSGHFILPSLESVKVAADFVATLPEDDFRVSITNAPGENAYPIASFTWLLVPSQWSDANKKITFLSIMSWALDHSEPSAAALGYPSLPKAVSLKVKKKIRALWAREKGMRAAN